MALSSFNSLKNYRPYLLKYDLSAGLSVFLVALPLCLGIALASGAPLFSGLVAGIIGGIVIGFFSGSEVSVSGPAAGLAVIVADAITKLGFESFLLAVVLAGIAQLIFGFIKVGRYSSFFPDSVIKGMLAAIGLVIILKQIPHALGRDNDYEGEFRFQQLADGENTISEIYKAIETASTGAVVISLLSMAVLLGWTWLGNKWPKGIIRTIPGALLVVILGVALNEAFKVWMPAWYLGDTAHQHMVQLPIIEAGQSFWSIFDSPSFSAFSNPQVYTVAITIALVASLETLLNLEASDKIDPQKRVSSPNQELIAQGIGNMASGLLGGLPVTSVVVRTSANVYGGARTRVSAIVHGLLLAIAVVAGGSLLNLIPLSCLAALLITVGYKLTKPTIYKLMYREGWSQFLPFIVTVVGIVFTDLLMGVAMGMVVSMLFILRENVDSTFRVIRENQSVQIVLEKDLYFLSKPKLKEALASLQPNDTVVVDGRKASFIDHDVYSMLTDFADTAHSQGIRYRLEDVQLQRAEPTEKPETIAVN